MTKNPFSRKLTRIKYEYGEKAKEYFIAHPSCENCSENRIVVLNIHHKHGKSVEEFKTLCFNCHMLHHAEATGEYTYSDYIKSLEISKKKSEEFKQKDAEIAEIWKKTNSLRATGRHFGISYNTVRNALIRQGII